MADAAEVTQKTGKIVSAGGSTRASLSEILGRKNVAENNGNEGTDKGADEGGEKKTGVKAEGADQNQNLTDDNQQQGTHQTTDKDKNLDTTTELTKEQIKELYDKHYPQTAEPTPEEIAAKDKAFEKRMLDYYVTTYNGKGEDFYKLKEAATADLTKLSEMELVRELKENGLEPTPENLNAIKLERYYQLNPEELEQGDEETETEFAARKELIKKKVAYGTAKLNNKGAFIKKNAEGFLNNITEALKDQDLQSQRDADTIAKIEEVSKTLPRKMSIELGKQDDKPLGLVDVDVPESTIAEIVTHLKDPASLKQIYNNEDETYNVERIAELLLKEKMLETVTREGLFEGQTRQVKIFEQTFPYRDAHAVGVGGAPSFSKRNGQPGKIVSRGEPQVINKPVLSKHK